MSNTIFRPDLAGGGGRRKEGSDGDETVRGRRITTLATAEFNVGTAMASTYQEVVQAVLAQEANEQAAFEAAAAMARPEVSQPPRAAAGSVLGHLFFKGGR